MAQSGDPQISWMTVVGAVAVVGLMSGAQWAVSQTQFANVDKIEVSDRAQATAFYVELRDRLTAVERKQVEIIEKLAHDPVEARTFQAVSDATDKRIDLIQAQITDINRQIAAALIIIDNNNAQKRATPTLPP